MARPLLLGGSWQARKRTMAVVDPENLAVIDHVARATPEDAAIALEHGHQAARAAKSLPAHQACNADVSVEAYGEHISLEEFFFHVDRPLVLQLLTPY